MLGLHRCGARCADHLLACRNATGFVSPSAKTAAVAWEDAGVLTPFRVSTLGPDGLTLLSLVYDSLVWKDEHGLIPWLASHSS